jgi:hypothetical protein
LTRINTHRFRGPESAGTGKANASRSPQSAITFLHSHRATNFNAITFNAITVGAVVVCGASSSFTGQW